MTIKMKSLKRHPWDGGFKQAGDQFDAEDEKQAKMVETLGWAVRAVDKTEPVKKHSSAPEPAAQTEAEGQVEAVWTGEKPKRKYTRRDMRAE